MNANRFDNYIEGNMTAEERSQFERDLELDSMLRKDFELHQMTVCAIRRSGAKEFLKQYELARNHRRKVFRIRLLSGAIAACLLIAFGLHYYTVYLYENYGGDIKIEQVGLSRGDDDRMAEIYNAINNENYELAIQLINACEDEQYADMLQWYKAVCYMRYGKYLKAKKLLEDIAASDSDFAEDAKTALEAL
jgi:hypothetical protein